jgi:hypothetical protein
MGIRINQYHNLGEVFTFEELIYKLGWMGIQLNKGI